MHTGKDRKTTPRAARGDHTCEEKKKVPGMFDPEHGKENEKSEMTKKNKKIILCCCPGTGGLLEEKIGEKGSEAYHWIGNRKNCP